MKTLLIPWTLMWLSISACADDTHWFRGNLHTHTLWSDGDQFPEVVVDWYKSHNYDFVAISDHNTLGDAERWIAIDGEARSRALQSYRDLYPEDWIEAQESDSGLTIRLKRFAEFAPRFNGDGFLLIQGEEITSRFENRPLHVNATNLAEFIDPQTGSSVVEVLQNNVDAVLAQRARTGQPMFPHINHPNFGWAVTVEDLMALEGERFFEVYNGHPSVHNEGDSLRPGMERMWDIILADKVSHGEEVMFGIAVDDGHHYIDFSSSQANPGRGWVSVRAESLDPASIVTAMEQGAFYGSSGVEFVEIDVTNESMTLHIRTDAATEYVTEFIGTRVGFDSTTVAQPAVNGLPTSRRYSPDIGLVLKTVRGSMPSYSFVGDELYVRARVISSTPKENPYRQGEFERAWVQPVVLYRPEQ